MPNFIDPDENIIVFDQPTRDMTAVDLELVASAGVRTALKNLEWAYIETEQGHYDWSVPDEFVDRCGRVGIKVMFVTPDAVTTCMPDDWYCWSETGDIQRKFPNLSDIYSVFSPWHAEAQDYHDAFVKMVMDRYASYPVRAIRGGAHGGELIMPYEPCYFDPKAVESFRTWTHDKFRGSLGAFNGEEKTDYKSWEQVKPSIFNFGIVGHRPITKMWLRERLTDLVVRQQQLLVNRYGGEAWMMLAHCWKDEMHTGNFLVHDIVQIIRERVQPTRVSWIAFAHFNMGAALQGIALERLKDDVDFWTGSQYCEGLAENTPLAKKGGFRGFLTGPLSLEDGHNQVKIETWMVDALRSSIAEWRS